MICPLLFSRCCFLAVDCGRPQPLQNGSIIGEKTVYPHFVNHTCDEGFILRGSPKIKCQTNGTWSKTISFCEGKDHVIMLPCDQIIFLPEHPSFLPKMVDDLFCRGTLVGHVCRQY